MAREIESVAHAAGETVVKVSETTAMILEKSGPVVTEISNHAFGLGRVTIRVFGKVLSTLLPK